MFYSTRKSSCGKPYEAYRPQCNLSQGDTPVLAWGGIPVLTRGYPSPGNGVSLYPCPRYSPEGTWDQSLGKGLGTSLGYPNLGGELTENITFSILRMRAVIITRKFLLQFHEIRFPDRDILFGSLSGVNNFTQERVRKPNGNSEAFYLSINLWSHILWAPDVLVFKSTERK